MRDRGYLIPTIPQPSGFRCVIIYLPDDDYYLYALAGQLYDLSTWLTWEKDGTNRASKAATAWKDALSETMTKGWLKGLIVSEIGLTEWNNLVTAVNELSNITQKLEDINITLQQNECCEGGGGTLDPPGAGPLGDPDVDPPPQPFDSWSEYFTHKCRAANALIAEMYELSVALATHDVDDLGALGVTFVVELILAILAEAAIAAGLLAPLGALGVVAGAVIALAIYVLVNTAIDFDEVATQLINNWEDLVCSLYEGADGAASKTALEAEIDTLTGLTTVERAYLKLIVTQAGVNSLYDPNIDLTGFTHAQEVDCMNCDPGSNPSQAPDLTYDTLRITSQSGSCLGQGGENVWLDCNHIYRSFYEDGATWDGQLIEFAFDGNWSGYEITFHDVVNIASGDGGLTDDFKLIIDGTPDVWHDISEIPFTVQDVKEVKLYGKDDSQPSAQFELTWSISAYP